jgi:hypothetical protein
VSDEAADNDAPEPEPRPKRKKKKKRAKAPVERDDRPPFARGFPADPELDRLLEAFERGDYAAIRDGAPKLEKDAAAEDVRRAAGELLRRTRPDPLAVMLLLGAIGLLVFLSIWTWSHGHAP